MDDPDERECCVCGCTDDYACDGGCEWVDDDLCSVCAAEFRTVETVDVAGGVL